MARFCKFCGKQLEEGEVCTCQQAASQQAAADSAPTQFATAAQPLNNNASAPASFNTNPSQPTTFGAAGYNTQGDFTQQTQQAQYQQPVQQYQQQGQQNQPIFMQNNMFTRYMTNVKNFLDAPCDFSRTFVRSCQYKVSLIFMGVYAVLMGIFFMLAAFKFDVVFALIYALLHPLSDENNLINLPGTFFFTGIVTFGIACAFAAFIMMFVSLFKGRIPYKNALCVAGIASIVEAPFILISDIVALLVPTIFSAGFFIVLALDALAKLFALIVANESIKEGQVIKDNNAIYVTFLSFTACAVCTGIFYAIFNGIFLHI